MEPDADAEQARLEEKGTRGYLKAHTEKCDAQSPRVRRRRVAPRARFPARMNPISRSPSATNKCPSSFAPPPSRAPAARKWQQLNAKRYGTTRKFGYVEPPKEEMPPEVRGETRRGARPPPFPARSERRAKAADALGSSRATRSFSLPVVEALDAVPHPSL